MSEVLLNREQIMEIIPHRDPFLLIDEVLEMEVGVRIKARKYIKEEFKNPVRYFISLSLPVMRLAGAGAKKPFSSYTKQDSFAIMQG